MDNLIIQLSVFSILNDDVVKYLIETYNCNKEEVITILDDLNVVSNKDSIWNINLQLAHSLFSDFKFDNEINELLIRKVKDNQDVLTQLIHINYLLYTDYQSNAIDLLNNFLKYCDNNSCDAKVVEIIKNMISRYITLTNDANIIEKIKT